MMSRQNFIFTIGYDGDMAVVDRRAKARYGNASTMELARAGMFRAAYASTIYGEGDRAALKAFLDYYNSLAGTSYTPDDDVSRLFGVSLQGTITKTLEL